MVAAQGVDGNDQDAAPLSIASTIVQYRLTENTNHREQLTIRRPGKRRLEHEPDFLASKRAQVDLLLDPLTLTRHVDLTLEQTLARGALAGSSGSYRKAHMVSGERIVALRARRGDDRDRERKKCSLGNLDAVAELSR